MEIERKFLIEDITSLDLTKYKHKEIIQDYLYIDLFSVIRKRKIVQDDKVQYKYTIKTGKKGISVNEIERDLLKEEYEKLLINKNYKTLIKERYIIPYLEDLKIELDIFKGEYEGIVFAEIEFKDEKQAYNTKLPKWFGKDISNIITNSEMCFLDKEKVKKKIKD